MFKIFLDTEFTGLKQNSSLISIAFVAESGEEFYAEFTDYDKNGLSDWIINNVISNLFLNDDNQKRTLNKMHVKGNRQEIKSALLIWLDQFCKNDDCIQIWADVPAYDWVLFCELFGGALNVPKQIHFMPMDLATFLFAKGVDYIEDRINLLDKSKLPIGQQHNALFDAKVGFECLMKYMEK